MRRKGRCHEKTKLVSKMYLLFYQYKWIAICNASPDIYRAMNFVSIGVFFVKEAHIR
jgi:hypothetical protein